MSRPAEKNKKEVVEDFITQVGGNLITVPKGFLYNGASIPSGPFGVLWYLFGTPYLPCFDSPSCVHDYLYDSQCDIDITRKTSGSSI